MLELSEAEILLRPVNRTGCLAVRHKKTGLAAALGKIGVTALSPCTSSWQVEVAIGRIRRQGHAPLLLQQRLVGELPHRRPATLRQPPLQRLEPRLEPLRPPGGCAGRGRPELRRRHGALRRPLEGPAVAVGQDALRTVRRGRRVASAAPAEVQLQRTVGSAAGGPEWHRLSPRLGCEASIV